MKNFKNILLSVILVLVAVFGVVACGGAPSTPPAPTVYDVYFETFGYCEVPTQEIEEGNVATRPTPDPECATHNFGGWYTDMSYTTEFDFTTPITQDIDLYAKWMEKESTYTITFDRNGHGKAPAKQYIEAGTDGKITKPNDLSANGWKFVGWSLDKEDKNNLLDFDSFIPTSSLTLYAQWLQVLTVSFDLNNDEALFAPPESQSVESGSLAQKPNDPALVGFKFDGWYTDKECTQAFDFSTPVTKKITIYAKWTKTAVGTIDGSDLPAYDWEKDSAYGERPDLDGFVIDGKMGAEEKWEEQKWYHTGITEAPTVSYDFTTRFSDKGLYFFVKAVDNGGLAFTGRGYYYKNTSFDISIINGDLEFGDANKLKTISFDTYNAKPSLLKFKLATRIIEGEVNPSSDYKTGVWTTECFITWKELGMSEKPQSVRVFPQYNYKRVVLDEKTLKLYPTFLTSTSINGYKSFIPFGENGYSLADEENAKLGDSPLGIAKTQGWNISEINDSTNAYLEADETATGTQAIFFKEIEGKYYSVQADVEIKEEAVASGEIGLMVYASPILYTAYQLDLSSLTLNQNAITAVTPKHVYTNSAGVAVSVKLDRITFAQPVQKINIRVIFANGYVYFIVNNVLVHSQYFVDLNERTNAAISGQNVKGIRLTNYEATLYTPEESSTETSKYARMISVGKAENVSVSFSSIGQSVENPQPITMYLRHRNLVLTKQIAEAILNGDYSRVIMYELDKIYEKTVGAEQVDISDAMFNAESGIKWGEYVFETIDSDKELSFISRRMDTSNLTYVTFNLIDSLSQSEIARTGNIEIRSDDGRISYYSVNTISSNVVVPIKKGYNYEITLLIPGYRTKKISYTDNSLLANVSGEVDLGDIALTLNVVGGTAEAPDRSFSVTSAVALWDYTNEENGEVYIEPLTAQSTQAFFSGNVIGKHQVAEVKIANVTDKVEHPSYEKDPAAGFCFVNKTGTSERKFVGLHKNGLRILYTRSGGWNPTDIYSDKLGSTVNKADTTGNSYTTLTVVKIDKGDYADVYTYVNGIFIEKITFDGLGGYSAIGFDITTSYYLKLKFFDYWIKTDDEALEVAKSMFGNTIDLDDTCYDLDYSTGEADFTKPIIKLDNLEEITYGDGTTESVAMLGSKVKISLIEENTIDGAVYIADIGNKSYVLTKANPIIEHEIVEAGEDIKVGLKMSMGVTVTGKVLADGAGSAETFGELIAEDGTIISFTTNVDGTFSVDVMSNMTYSVKFEKNMYAFEAVNKRVRTSDIDFGEFNLIPVVFGGEGSTNQAKWGYNYNDGTISIAGLYTEVNAKADNTQLYTYSTIDNAVIDFSFVRLDIPAVTDEQYPAIGVCIITEDGVREFYGVQYSGGVVLDGKDQWNAPIKVSNVLSFTTKGFNLHFDVRVVKYGNTVSIFAKLPTDTEYTYIMTHTSRFNLYGATIALRVTAAAPSHHFFYNEKVTQFTDDTLPADVARTLSITANAGGDYEVVNAKAQYVVGENAQIKLIPQSGKVGFIRVNGSEYFYPNADGIVVYEVKQNANDIEVYFEDKAEDITVTGKLVATEGVTIPSTFNFSAIFEDGRVYEFDGVEIAADGSFTFEFREGSFTIRATNGSLVAKTAYVSLTKNASDIGTLEVYDIFIGGNSESYGSTSVPIYGYDFDDGANQIAGPYMEVNQRGNSYMAMRIGKVKDFEFSFSYIRKIAEGYENEQWPAIGLVFNDGTGSESYLFQDKSALVLEKGVGWSKPVKFTTKLSKSMYTADLAFDYKITRKGNTFTFYGKVATDDTYTKLGEYTSATSFGEIETRLTVTAASTQLRYIVYGISYKAL